MSDDEKMVYLRFRGWEFRYFSNMKIWGARQDHSAWLLLKTAYEKEGLDDN